MVGDTMGFGGGGGGAEGHTRQYRRLYAVYGQRKTESLEPRRVHCLRNPVGLIITTSSILTDVCFYMLLLLLRSCYYSSDYYFLLLLLLLFAKQLSESPVFRPSNPVKMVQQRYSDARPGLGSRVPRASEAQQFWVHSAIYCMAPEPSTSEDLGNE